jgi:hypothetical protein
MDSWSGSKVLVYEQGNVTAAQADFETAMFGSESWWRVSDSNCFSETRAQVRLVRFGTAILLVPLHRIPPPKESMKAFGENRRLLKSIAFLAEFTIALE